MSEIFGVRHNITAMFAHRQATLNNGTLTKALERLSSGYRINRASDDAAGLAVSEKLRAQVRGYQQAAENIQDGLSLLQTEDAGLQTALEIVQRMRELAVQSANGIYTDSDRALLNTEFDQLTSELDRMRSSIEFNRIRLLSGPNNTGTGQFVTENYTVSTEEFTVVTGAGFLDKTSPFLAQDGNSLIYYDTDGGGQGVYRINIDGTGNTLLNATPSFFQGDLEYNTKNTQITFTDGTRLFTMNFDGTGLSQLTNAAASTVDASFSPDGTQIVYSSSLGGFATEIRTINADNSNDTQIIAFGSEALSPIFSSDASKIYYYRNTVPGGPTYGVFSVNIDGSNETQISSIFPDSTSFGLQNIALTPAGDKIIYSGGTGGGSSFSSQCRWQRA